MKQLIAGKKKVLTPHLCILIACIPYEHCQRILNCYVWKKQALKSHYKIHLFSISKKISLYADFYRTREQSLKTSQGKQCKHEAPHSKRKKNIGI